MSKTKYARREFLNLSLAVGATALFAGCAGLPFKPRSSSKKPNIVVLLADDLGYGDLGCQGHPIIKTPNLDRLAQQGVRFTDCHSAGALCSPSRSGLLTGRCPIRLGVDSWIPKESANHLRSSEITVPELLKSIGYDTCHVGKFHCNGQFNSPNQPQPGDQGFDYWFSTQNNAEPTHLDPDNFVRNGQPVGKIEGYSSAIIVDEAIHWLRNRSGKKPFCLFVCFHATHQKIATAQRFTDMYKDIEYPDRAVYYGNATQMDYEAGRLLEELNVLNQADNSFVFFTSDNGPTKWTKGPNGSYGSKNNLRGMKGEVYEGGIRIPGIMRWPGQIKLGTICDAPINGTDILPTVCSIAGVPVPGDETMDGVDITPLFDGRSIERKIPLFWESINSKPEIAIRDGDWKLLTLMNFERVELYNLKNDVSESTDVSSNQPEIAQRLLEAAKKLHAEMRAESPGWIVEPKRK